MNNLSLSCRRFLQAASSIAVAAASLSATSSVAGILTADNKMSALERQLLQKMLNISLPTKGSILVDPATLPVLDVLESALLAGMAADIRAGLRGGIGYFNDSAKAEYGKPFVALNDTDATRFVDAWSDGNTEPQRALAMGLKKLTVLAYWAIPNSWAPLGYNGPISDRAGLKSLGNAPEPRG